MPEDSTLQDLKNLHEQARSARRSFEDDWLANLAHYQGLQWHYVQGGRLSKPRLASHRVMFTDNRILGIIRTEIAKLVKDRPVFTVTPRTGDDEDVQAAQLGERVLDYVWQQHRLRARLRSALLWARICTAGFWKVYWDSQAGEEAEAMVGPNGEPLTDANGRLLRTDREDLGAFLQALPPEAQAQLQTKKVHRGDLCIEVRSPFELLPDPLAEEGGLEDAEWLIEESVRSKEYVAERYDKEIEPDAEAVPGIAESRMSGTSGAQGKAGSYKGVKVSEYWHRPSAKHPRGRRVVWAAEELLAEDDNPYGDLPYVMFSGIPVPGRFWPTSTAEHLRPPQTEMNKTRSQLRENAARFGNPSLLKSRHANVSYSGLPGEEIEYDATLQDSIPSYLRPPEMPAYVQSELDRMEQSLREISGQFEVTKGQVPAGVTAASAINLLQEADETRLAGDVQDLEHALALAGTKVLGLVARFYTDQRTIHIAGDDGAWDIEEFRGEMLGDNTQVEVQAGSAMPRSKAAKQAAMQEVLNLMVQYGVPLNPRNLRRFFRGYEVGGLEALFADVGQDERQINRENRLLSRGEEVPLNSFDNDELHIEGHEEFQKSSRYAQLDPAGQQTFEAHVAEHRERFIEAQDAAAKAANPDALTNGEQGSVRPDAQASPGQPIPA